MAVKVDIISGFLGAGKTTLIKKLLEEKLSKEKLVIIENEFGEIGIDGTLLKKSGIEIKEINSGCICCSLVGEFERSLQEVIARFQPDRVIIEPSGIGKLSEVIRACSTPKIQELVRINMILTVVDIMQYELYVENFGEFYTDQILHAKTIIFSRTQNVPSEKVEEVARDVHRLNPEADLVTTPWDDLKGERIIQLAEGKIQGTWEPHGHPQGCACGDHHHDRCDHHHHAVSGPDFEVWNRETPRIFPEKELRQILHQLDQVPLVGRVLRGKGILQSGPRQWMQFDYVPGEVNICPTEPDYSGRFCIIGSNLNKKELTKLFQIMD